MKKLLVRAAASAALLLGSYTAQAASCPWYNQGFNQIASSAVDKATSDLMKDLVGGGDSLNTAVTKAANDQSKAITDAVFILANQKALTTEQIARSIKDNTQIQANAQQSINQAKRYQQAIRDYGPQGIGYNVCEVSIKRESIKDATLATQQAIEGMVETEITARAGRYADKDKAMATRLALHKKYYCTTGQAQAGLCSGAGERAGASLSAATMFQPADYLSAEYNDKSALINNMVGLPDDPVPADQAATKSGQAYADLKRRKDAIKSTAMTSLKAIQADWSSMPSHANHDSKTPAAAAVVKTEKEQLVEEAPKTVTAAAPKTDANGTPVEKESIEDVRNRSLMTQVQSDVSRYLGGGSDYEEWSKTLTGQEEKGVLTEVLKVKALRLYLQTQEFKQLQRMEAMFAANVAATTENSGMAARVETQRQVALRQTIKDNIR